MLSLRPYQRTAIDSIYAYFMQGGAGNPIVVAPTGSGKSLLLATLCKETLERWPDQRLVILAHRKELLQQNFEELIRLWPEAPAGLYSAGLRARQLGRKITIAGIQSVYNKASAIGWKSLILVDECFTGDTMISVPGGQRRMDLMRSGDYVYNGAGIGKVEAVSARLATELWKLEFSDGTKITCTPNHPIFTGRGWRQARDMERGEITFSEKGVLFLWQRNVTKNLGVENGKRTGTKRKHLEEDEILFNLLCQEIRKSHEQPQASSKDASNTKKDRSSSNSARRERSTAAPTTTCTATRIGGGVGSGACDSNACGALQRGLSQLLQDRSWQSGEKNRHRTRRRLTRIVRAQGAGCKEDLTAYFPRLVNISRVQPESARTVYNLQVSGHPSYFAGGKLVHNCHLIPSDGEGMYRTFIEEMKKINPHIKVIGFTATPFRMKSGMLVEPGGIFTDIAYDITVIELIKNGYLCPVISKAPETQADLSEVHVRGGEYVPGEAERAMNTEALTRAAIKEINRFASDRKSILVFCAGVQHAEDFAKALREEGQTAECVSGETDDLFRAQHIEGFKKGRIRFITNCDILSTGFNAPNVDCIVFLRPTKSTGLYVQVIGRGMRLFEGKQNCLVLDFAGNIERHGPIDMVRVQRKSGEKEGKEVSVAPVKLCPQCRAACLIMFRSCPYCGYEFPDSREPKHNTYASTAPVIAAELPIETLEVESVDYKIHRKEGKPPSMRVTYNCKRGSGNLGFKSISEWICFEHQGYAYQKAIQWWFRHHRDFENPQMIQAPMTSGDAITRVGELRPVKSINTRMENGFDRVLKVDFKEASQVALPMPAAPAEPATEEDFMAKYNI